MRDDDTGFVIGDGRLADGRFGPGNPGRPRGSRNRMTNEVVMVLLDDFWRNEADVIAKARRWFLPDYLRFLARFLPRETRPAGPDLASYGPAEQAALVAAAKAALAAIERGEAGLDDLMAVLERAPEAARGADDKPGDISVPP